MRRSGGRNGSEAGDADQRRSTVRRGAWYSVNCSSALPEILRVAEWLAARSRSERRAIRGAIIRNGTARTSGPVVLSPSAVCVFFARTDSTERAGASATYGRYREKAECATD